MRIIVCIRSISYANDAIISWPLPKRQRRRRLQAAVVVVAEEAVVQLLPRPPPPRARPRVPLLLLPLLQWSRCPPNRWTARHLISPHPLRGQQQLWSPLNRYVICI